MGGGFKPPSPSPYKHFNRLQKCSENVVLFFLLLLKTLKNLNRFINRYKL